MDLIPNSSQSILMQNNGEDEHSTSEQGFRGLAIPYSAILEHMPESFLALDNQWRIMYLNQQAEPFLQKTRRELVGRNIFEVIPKVQDSPLFQYCQQA